MVLMGFSGDGFLKQLFEIFLAAPFSKRSLHVHLVISKKAGPDSSVGCQPEAVAGRAKMVTQGADEANFTSARLKAISLGRPGKG